MKISLISPYPDITAFGLRLISAYLKANGHKTTMIFLPDPYGDATVHGVERYEDSVLNQIIPLCEESDLIGITLMTNYFDSAVQITKKLKEKLKAPIVWGGVHATIRPEESLKHADIVCIGDGEEAILELANRMDAGGEYLNTHNLWFRSDEKIIKNPLHPIAQNLDIYPIPDYSRSDHYIMIGCHIRRLTNELTKLFFAGGTVSIYLNKIGYQTMTGRGCPHKCTYCINDTIKNLYKGQVYLRWRSTVHVMEELLWVKKHMPFVGFIWISDDAFFARSTKDIKEFCKSYKDKIGLPFTCLASPLTVTEDKMAALIDAGLIFVQMGIESGSRRIQEIFNRKQMSNERMMNAIRIINKYKDRMFPPSYDFILDTPYETDEDKIHTLRFISEMPKPYRLQPFSLVLSPGTKLYEMAKTDGFIGNEKLEIYAKTWAMREHNYFNLLITIAKNGNLPSFLLKFLISRAIVILLNNKLIRPHFSFFYIVLKRIYGTVKRLLGKNYSYLLFK